MDGLFYYPSEVSVCQEVLRNPVAIQAVRSWWMDCTALSINDSITVTMRSTNEIQKHGNAMTIPGGRDETNSPVNTLSVCIVSQMGKRLWLKKWTISYRSLKVAHTTKVTYNLCVNPATLVSPPRKGVAGDNDLLFDKFIVGRGHRHL